MIYEQFNCLQEGAMSPNEPVLVGGARDVRGTLTVPDSSSETTACVVACPPHPQMGGSRSDARLTAVSNDLAHENGNKNENVDNGNKNENKNGNANGYGGIASLRFDYGEWAEGVGEHTDTLNAVRWASDRYDRVGLYGFSFGGTLALLAGAEMDVACVSALAPASRISELDAVDALDDIDCPVQIVYGERDSTADWKPVVERARALDYTVEGMRADHFFVGQTEKVAARVVEFLRNELK